MVIMAIGLALAFLWFVPWWVDSRRAYRLRERAIDLVGGRLLDAVHRTDVKISDLQGMLVTLGQVATSPVETARALMSFILITIVGVALAALLLSSAGDASDLRKTLLSSILTLLGTIVGFYFGTRAAEATSPPPAPPLPAAPAEAAWTEEAADPGAGEAEEA